MTDYSVKAPVLYGCGAIKALGERVRGFGAKKPMLICDPNLDPATYDKAVETIRQADHCISCNTCVSHCPQHIRIPRELRRIDNYVEALKQEKL